MVRNYKRKTEDRWSKEDLLEALTNIKEAKIKINDAARQYRISRATLYRQFKKFLQAGGKCDVNQFRTCGGNPILTKVEEDVLEKTIRDLREQGFTVTSSDIKRICFEYCDSNGIPNQFNQEKRMASDDWYYGFLKRHPDVRIGDGTTPIEVVPVKPKKKKSGKSKATEFLIKMEPNKSPVRQGTSIATSLASGSSSPTKLAKPAQSLKKAAKKRKAPAGKKRSSKKAKKTHNAETVIVKQEDEILEQMEDENDDEEQEEDEDDEEQDDVQQQQAETDGSSKAEEEDEESSDGEGEVEAEGDDEVEEVEGEVEQEGEAEGEEEDSSAEEESSADGEEESSGDGEEEEG